MEQTSEERSSKREEQIQVDASVCKNCKKASDRVRYVTEDQRIGFILLYRLKNQRIVVESNDGN